MRYYWTPASGVVALSNNAPNDKNSPPPEGLYWGDGELKTAPKRPLANSPGLKGVFTDSVIARLPEVQVEEDAVAQLFASDARLPAPSLTPPAPAKPNAVWHEPGNALQGGVPPSGKPMTKPTPAAAAAAMVGAVAQRGAATAAGPKRGAPPAGALGGLPAGALGAPVVGDFGVTAAKARRTSLPAGALREGRTPKQAEQAMQAAARAEAAAQQTRTFDGGIEPSGLELDIPPANANARNTSGAPPGRSRPQINAVVDKHALTASMRAAAEASGSNEPGARASLHDAVTATRTIAQDAGASLRAHQPEDGLTLDVDRAETAFRGSAPLGAGGTLRAGAGAQSSQRAGGPAGPPSLRSTAASDDERHAAIIEGEEPAAADASSNSRPKSGKERRAEARRAARRKAAKHLPPPPAAPQKPALDPAKITLLSFAAVLGLGALGIAAAEAGFWELPPRAATMLGLENARASLSNAKPGQQPHLVMPADPSQPKVQAPAPQPAPAEPTLAAPLAGEPPPPAAAWNTVEEETPAPLMADAPEPVEASPAPAAPAGTAQPSSTTVAPENQASATAPGTMPAAVAATPKAVVTLSPPAAPSGTTENAVEEFTLDEASGGTPGDRAVSAKLVALARSKLRARDAAGAAEMMLRQVTADPEDHHAMEVLIRAWIAMGRGEDAVDYAELIVKKRPRRAAYRVLEGDARLAAGDPAGAQVAWRVALQLQPENQEAKRRLGLP